MNLIKYQVQNVVELNKKYICRSCRAIFSNTQKAYLNKSRLYQKTQKILQEEVNIYIKRGLNDAEARNNFLNNVKTILDSCHIKCYSFYVSDNVLKGIKVEQVPFWGNIVIPLKG
jgi:hypothetical protein